MESKKIDNQGAIIKSFLLMTVVLAFIGGFVISGDLKKLIDNSTTKEELKESDDVFTAATKNNKTLGFDGKYVMSDDNLNYKIDLGTYAGTTNIYFKLNFGNTNKEIVVSRYNYDNEDVQEYTLTFTNNVVDIFFGRLDDEPENNTIFYLLDNGDVCYSPVESMVKEDMYGMYFTMDNIQGIVKFYSGESCNEETGACLPTTFAQKKDGKIFDLKNYVIK